MCFEFFYRNSWEGLAKNFIFFILLQAGGLYFCYKDYWDRKYLPTVFAGAPTGNYAELLFEKKKIFSRIGSVAASADYTVVYIIKHHSGKIYLTW